MKKIVGILPLLLILSLRIQGETSENYTIGNVVYRIEGNVKETALNAVLDWDTKSFFQNKWELESYLREQKQTLIKKKVFKSVNVDYRVLGNTPDYIEVEALVEITAAWNLYPIPIYKYDSNLGTMTGLGSTYYNFMGTLTDLGLVGYYSPGRSEITASLAGVRFGSLDLDFSLSQFWEEVKSINEEEEINLQYTYAKTVFDISLLFRLMDRLGYLINPSLLFPFSYDIALNETDREDAYYTDSGFTPSFSHMLLYDQVNWIGNLRQGFSLSVENGLDYQSRDGEYILWVDGILTTFVYTPVMNYNSRVSSFYYRNGYRENSGDRIRGVLDYKLTGNWGFFWNQNFVIPVVTVPSLMDLHMTPFMDMGFVGDASGTFKRDELQYTAGISLSVFPAPLPNVQISLDYGINMNDTREREILISSVLYF